MYVCYLYVQNVDNIIYIFRYCFFQNKIYIIFEFKSCGYYMFKSKKKKEFDYLYQSKVKMKILKLSVILCFGC